MPDFVIANFLMYSGLNAFTPGPGNILALNTMANYGPKRGRALFLGIFAGYYVVQLLCALIVCSMSSFLPGALGVVKYVGAAYILWLAVHIALSRPDEPDKDHPASFWKGFVLQFANIKIWLFGITALTGYVVSYSTDLAVLIGFELVIATMGTLATLTWIGAGAVMRRVYRRHFRLINGLLALALLECVCSILMG